MIAPVDYGGIDIKRFVGMIANQRSGTHLMRGCFNSHPDVFCPPEPLYRCAPDTHGGLVEFIRSFDGDDRKIVLDIKYDQSAFLGVGYRNLVSDTAKESPYDVDKYLIFEG